MFSCIARQPIFNPKLKIFGYEILYRNTPQSTAFDSLDGDLATSETIMNTFHEIGIERVTGGKRAFINFTEKLLLDKVATILPNRILVIELLENIPPSKKVLNTCEELQKRGYLLALDDFILEPKYFPLLKIADIVKIDFLNTPIKKISRFAEELKNTQTILLAEKLETKEMYDLAVELGFTLFQGYFFSKPVIMSSPNKLGPQKINCMQLIRLAREPNVNFTKIANIIKPLPTYIQKNNAGLHGIGGCAILGDGSISLIIDINNLVL